MAVTPIWKSNCGRFGVLHGDCRETLKAIPDGSVHCCVTSPPYWGLRSYLSKDHPNKHREIGQEKTPEEFVETMVEVFREVRRCLHDSGTLFLNLGDSYNAYNGNRGASKSISGNTEDALPDLPSGHGLACETLKPKDLCGIPWRVVLALQADGWFWRSCIVWHKKSCMPESVTDRPTNSWEPVFLLAKSQRYFYDSEAVKERSGHAGTPRRNQRNVWSLGPEPYHEAHFATFPTEIPRRAIRAGTSERGCCPKCLTPWERLVETSKTFGWQPGCKCGLDASKPCLVLDPFGGSGTTMQVAAELGRCAICCELNEKYVNDLMIRRIEREIVQGDFIRDKPEALRILVAMKHSQDRT